MSEETSSTFGGIADRVTHIAAEAPILIFGAAISIGAAIVIFRPDVGVPGWVVGMVAISMLFGPALFGFWFWLLELFRKFRWQTVWEINAATDTREKWFVKPALWDSRKTDGPAPYRCNDDSDFEVREFEFDEDLEQIRVRGSHLAQMQDSRLLTFQTLVYDLHETFAQEWQEKVMARARETRRGLEQQEAVVNAQAEATERGLMEPRGIVAESWEESLEELRDDDDYLEIEDFESYQEGDAASWAPEPIGPEPDGGEP